MTSYYFAIIGTNDTPLYELEFSSFKLAHLNQNHIPGKSQFAGNIKELLPFVTHASLDLIEDNQWVNNQFNLGKIDGFYGLLVNAFVTQGNIKFIMCYDGSSSANLAPNTAASTTASNSGKYDENSLKQFFMEANELYVKCLMNPFYTVNDPITSPEFDLKIKLLARKYL